MRAELRQGTKLDLVLREDTVHAAHSGFQSSGSRPRCYVVLVDVDMSHLERYSSSAFTLSTSVKSVPVPTQTQRVKLMLDLRGTMDEVVETAI